MSVHYGSFAGEHQTRKTLSIVARKISTEYNGGVNQRFFNARFVRDNNHSES